MMNRFNNIDLTNGKVIWTSKDGKTKAIAIKSRGRKTVYLVSETR